MKIRHSLAILAGVAATLAFTGCAAASTTDGFPGSWGQEKAGQPSLTISDDGSFNGTDGCNSLTGKGTISGDNFDFGGFALTRMACPDVDAWLSGATSATVAGGTITVFDASGAEIGTLDRR